MADASILLGGLQHHYFGTQMPFWVVGVHSITKFRTLSLTVVVIDVTRPEDKLDMLFMSNIPVLTVLELLLPQGKGWDEGYK